MAFDVQVQYAGTPQVDKYETPVAVRPFWGVVGAQVLIGKSSVRKLTFDVTITDKESLADCMAVVAQFDAALNSAKLGKLTAPGGPYPQCVFTGFIPDETPFYDGSGVHGWTLRGKVSFLQIAGVTE